MLYNFYFHIIEIRLSNSISSYFPQRLLLMGYIRKVLLNYMCKVLALDKLKIFDQMAAKKPFKKFSKLSFNYFVFEFKS